MKILMMTNSYTPMVGGIEESIRSFTLEFEKLGHEVFIVAPECEGAPPDEVGVIRLRAIENVNNSHFSFALPMSGLLPELMKTFKPDIIHCHHPFWIGNIALRLSGQYQIPLIFTYHTMYEHHLHYLPVHNDGVKRFIIELFAGYANLSNQVVVPSESVREVLWGRGVKTPIAVVPTGVDLQKFSRGDGQIIRKRLGIPPEAVVVGYVGRLAIEKNLEFLSHSAAAYLRKNTKAHFLVGGDGPLKDLIEKIFQQQGVKERLHLAGLLKGQDLVDCYHAMNVFAFASLSETQGIVLVEAMAAGVPVVAVDAPGVREVVKDGVNGRLIWGEDQGDFADALAWCLGQPADDHDRIKANAVATSKEFALDLCANKMLEVYQEVVRRKYASPDHSHDAWVSLVERLKREWDLFQNVLQSGGAAVVDAASLKRPVARRSALSLLHWPHLLSLSELSAKLLRLPRVEGAQTEPGLVLIQIDGLSDHQLKHAIARHTMPFLKGLLHDGYYKAYRHYSGLPSSTPSVQGELFYGVKQAVPAFAFRDRATGRIFRMYDSDAAQEVEGRLARQAEGLLREGSSYSNIYTGGARESHFCATSLGWDKIGKDVNPVNAALLAITHLVSLMRMAALTVWEMALGVVGFGLGILKGKNVFQEFKFIYLRALICVLLRELVSLGAKIDIARGLPVIHLNFLGYDEHAHNRGPSSPSAHSALRGIDRAIGNIYRRALRAPRRNYDVWVYSDHGQEDTICYAFKYGRSVQEAVAEVFQEFDGASASLPVDHRGEQLQRAHFLGLASLKKDLRQTEAAFSTPLKEKLVVTAIGPTGNIYLPRTMDNEEARHFARALVEKAKIPVVLRPQGQGQVRAWNEQGEFTLPQDAAKILGANHPYFEQVTQDLISVCHHPDAGDFTLLGYQWGRATVTFPVENGAHAGPGPEETNGFALLPSDIALRQRQRKYIMPLDLRYAALRFLKRSLPQEPRGNPEVPAPAQPKAAPDTIRVMTYNVHSCIGMDGKISPERIARVIGRHEPDIVALQELDMNRKRTGGDDQPHLIAKELEMHYHFHPSLIVDQEHYGNAVLSRFPMELMRAGRLPGISRGHRTEPRGVIWTAVHVGGIRVNCFNTHFGLFPREGNLQAIALLGSEWLTHIACHAPVVLCGDFNALPNSQICRRITKVFRDAQGELDDHSPKATWFSHYPVSRIDHVFISPQIEVTHVKVSRTDLEQLASDHLPLIVDVRLSRTS